jgi:hypothetical protein
VWILQHVVRPGGAPPGLHLLIIGILLWAPGDYFCRTGHRGLIYHHADLLADYLDRRLHEARNSAA